MFMIKKNQSDVKKSATFLVVRRFKTSPSKRGKIDFDDGFVDS